jgi:hypothetical protein
MPFFGNSRPWEAKFKALGGQGVPGTFYFKVSQQLYKIWPPIPAYFEFLFYDYRIPYYVAKPVSE